MSPFVHVLRAAGASFPTLVATTGGGTDSLTADPTLDLSGLSLTEGNLMVMIFKNASGTHSGISGWTSEGSITYTARDDTLSVWSKVVGASEPTSQQFFISGSDRCGWVCREYSGAHGDVEAAFAESIDPPSLTPAWGSANTRWLAGIGVGASSNTLTEPTSYGTAATYGSAASTADSRAKAGLADRDLAAASENPGVWTASGTFFYTLTATIAIRPA